jgi:ATP-dependent Lon protease
MSDDLVKRLRRADEYEPLGHDGWEAADRIEQLVASNEYLNSRLENVLAREAETYAEHKELLEAARADAKEAEAYADELEKDQVDLCRQLIAAEDKLAKAMELVTFASNMDVTDWSEALDVKDQARTTLAEIEGSDAA